MTTPVTDPKGDAMEDVLARLDAEDRNTIEMALRIPDLYPARSIRDALQGLDVAVRVSDIHAWRNARGIKKATC